MGEPARGLYVVVEGAIRAFRESSDREQVIHIDRAGATFAEVPVFDDGPYPSTVAGEEDCVLLFIAKDDMKRLCLEHPAIMFGALKMFARRLRATASLVETLSLRDVDRRLARLLLAEAQQSGARTGECLAFELMLTHQQIAARIGSVREVVSRGFSRLQQHDLIRVDGHKITIPAEKALAAYAFE